MNQTRSTISSRQMMCPTYLARPHVSPEVTQRVHFNSNRRMPGIPEEIRIFDWIFVPSLCDDPPGCACGQGSFVYHTNHILEIAIAEEHVVINYDEVRT